MKKEMKISEIPDNIELKDLPEDTVIIWDDVDPASTDDFWEEEE